jgi:hypothetical protein
MVPDAQLPQTPPQPSSPQLLPLQLGVQHCPTTHVPPLQVQSLGQLSQLSVGSQLPSPHDACPVHLPLAQT